ncbi:hypothetical protein ALC56_08461, partial [Trachymyrmex septentrionalis]
FLRGTTRAQGITVYGIDIESVYGERRTGEGKNPVLPCWRR